MEASLRIEEQAAISNIDVILDCIILVVAWRASRRAWHEKVL
jgi:hypothetical protein